MDDEQIVEGGGEGGTEGGVDPSTGQYIPKQRFDQVYGKMKDYETKAREWSEFGNPGEVKSRLQKLQEWEQAVEEQRKQASMGDDEKAAAQNQKKIRAELLKYYPELAEINSLKELREEIASMKGAVSTSQVEAVAGKASAELSGMMATAKIDAKHQGKIEDFLFSQMTKEEQMQFSKGDFSRMKEIFDNELNEGLLSAYKRGPKLPETFVRHKPGGTTPKAANAKPKTLEEATNDAWSKMAG
jgi:hypothetical protein